MVDLVPNRLAGLKFVTTRLRSRSSRLFILHDVSDFKAFSLLHCILFFIAPESVFSARGSTVNPRRCQ